MPRQKRILGPVHKTTAMIPIKLDEPIRQQLAKPKEESTLAEAINDGLVLWLASKTGGKLLQTSLTETLEEWKPRFYEKKIEPVAESRRKPVKRSDRKLG